MWSESKIESRYFKLMVSQAIIKHWIIDNTASDLKVSSSLFIPD